MQSIVVLIVFLPACIAAVTNVLVLGGNGFIGSETVHQLLESEGDKVRLTLLNRGNSYWDSSSRITPRINPIYCSRNSITQCDELISSKKFYDFVLDFSSYVPRNMAEIIDILTDRVGVYIYISTDSVYEVCQRKEDSSEYLREEDAVRPASNTERRELNARDNYGHRKLGCEELLLEQRENGGFPYVILRLPDVIGPRDNTDRWWRYQLWIRFHVMIGQPIYMLDWMRHSPLSLVYNKDVAKIIVVIMKESANHIDSMYNLAFSEVTTLHQLLLDMADVMQVSEPIFSPDNTVRNHFFPSVTRGPISIEKALRQLNWQPTSLKQAIGETVEFYEQAMINPQSKEKRDAVLSDFKSVYVPADKQDAFDKRLVEIYHHYSRDEL
ncbi:uncharacterized protein LOC134179187 [Corticium candelabrum]|uniref:uncharacterized protein LOC134179187 n=1 Tax=Corticium candelabrum TaxID=121492 RepID=UPI002E25A5FA|nr:uncharacterized protein LOC134179187 [Corticium candelabrum]